MVKVVIFITIITIIVVITVTDSIEEVIIFIIIVVVDKLWQNVKLKVKSASNQMQLFIGLIITRAALWLIVMLRSTKKSASFQKYLSLTKDSANLEDSFKKFNWLLC